MPTNNPVAQTSNSTLEYGRNLTIATNHPLTVFPAFGDIPGSGFRLSAVGIFLVTLNITSVAPVGGETTVQCYTSADVLVPNSDIKITSASSYLYTAGSTSFIINNTVANTLYKLKGQIFGANGNIQNLNTGFTRFSWQQLPSGAITPPMVWSFYNSTFTTSTIPQSLLQYHYDAVNNPNLGSVTPYNPVGGNVGVNNAPDTVPPEVIDRANSYNSSSYKLYLGHNVWWYTNAIIGTAASWTAFGSNKGQFGAPAIQAFTFR
jgi:hypothetical protein